jgi:DtxR family Mn-dependent transcriptional regulator
MEMYLKAVLVLEERKEVVRAKDLAEELGLSRPSITKAVTTLSKLGYLTHQPYLHLALTPKGRQLARGVLRRHQVIHTFLVTVLGIDPQVADEEACELEHVMSRSTVQRMTDFLAFLGQCPDGPREVVRHFQEVAAGGRSPHCAKCGIERLHTPELLEPETPVSGQHSRF